MKTLLFGAQFYENGTMKKQDMLFDGSSVCALSDVALTNAPSVSNTIANTVIIPGFCDVHVHFREPGFSYKETIATGSASASRGGYTAVCTMPNLNPTPDSPENIGVQLANCCISELYI